MSERLRALHPGRGRHRRVGWVVGLRHRPAADRQLQRQRQRPRDPRCPRWHGQRAPGDQRLGEGGLRPADRCAGHAGSGLGCDHGHRVCGAAQHSRGRHLVSAIDRGREHDWFRPPGRRLQLGRRDARQREKDWVDIRHRQPSSPDDAVSVSARRLRLDRRLLCLCQPLQGVERRSQRGGAKRRGQHHPRRRRCLGARSEGHLFRRLQLLLVERERLPDADRHG